MDAASSWDALAEPWRVCLSLAWEAYGAGTIPVGAALVDGNGTVVAEGRNRVYEHEAPPRQITDSLLAHAEVNALVGLDPERRYEDHVLYTALEPCLLCLGATTMATVGGIRYAGADPYGGADGGLIGVNPHVERETPHLLAVANALLDTGAPDLAGDGVPLPDALERLWPALTAGVASAANRRARP